MAKLFSNQRLKAVGRLLNDEEMEQVFGGYGIADEGLDQFLGAYGQPADDDDDDDDDIVVTGDPGEEDDDDNDDIVVTGDPGEDEYDGEGGDGAGGDEDYGDDDDDSEDGSGDEPLPPPTDDFCADQEASQAKSEINASNGHNSREFGSIVFATADGRVLHSPPLGGTTSTLALSVFTNWMNTNGVNWSDVRGMVHNHPDNIYGGSQLAEDVNRYPSPGDWGFAEFAVNHGASASDFSLYIIDTNGVMREFEYEDRLDYVHLSNSQKDSGTNLPPPTNENGCAG